MSGCGDPDEYSCDLYTGCPGFGNSGDVVGRPAPTMLLPLPPIEVDTVNDAKLLAVLLNLSPTTTTHQHS